MSSSSPPEAAVVYVDESANSGQNLLDVHQPVFTVAGVHLPDDLADAIVDEVRAQLPANVKEPKYSSLAGSSGGRKALMRAFSRLPEGSVQTYLVHKRFMVITKLVDLLVEPRAYANGINLYEGKQSLRFAEALYLGGPVLGDAGAYERLLQIFVDWVRGRVATDDLFEAIAALKASVQHTGFLRFVDELERCRDIADETATRFAAGHHKDEIDPAVTALYCLGLGFGESLGRHFRLVHDQSKVIDRNAVLLRTVHFFPDPARPGKFSRQLPVLGIEFADSETHQQLQLADWAAGATRQWAQHMAVGGGDRFSQELEAVARPWLIDGIWPPAGQA
ncbi:DUF3800 domain-containing protein [Streptomyces sp. NPDC048424]|uniref:DUF3800 domain-containing protein n=1 Tax=Streptomyces sp. NPDC048424 TaxID=3155265 RepID=UPI003449D21F